MVSREVIFRDVMRCYSVYYKSDNSMIFTPSLLPDVVYPDAGVGNLLLGVSGSEIDAIHRGAGLSSD